MSDGANAAKGLPGYKKTFTTGYYPEQYNTGPAAPPDAGLPNFLRPMRVTASGARLSPCRSGNLVGSSGN